MTSSSTSTHAPGRLLLAFPRAGARARVRALASVPCTHAGNPRRPWLARLRRALREDRFVLHLQPIVAVADGAVSHHEALLRLADEGSERLIAPGRFLPAAERYGLVRDIDRMVIVKAAELIAAGSGPLAVNVSALSVSGRGLLAHLRDTLAAHRVEASQLVVELTETAAISNMARASEFCAGVQALGCRVALDDFGAGFGSFQYLKLLPFSYLKIDGEFIRGLTRSRTDQLVVRALVGLARGLGRHTIAEFVGDAETLAMLRVLGVDLAQGFAIGPPQPAHALAL